MTENGLHDIEVRISRRRETSSDTPHEQGVDLGLSHQRSTAALLRSPSLRGRGNSQTRAHHLLAAQRTHGNRAVQRSTSMPQPANLEDLVRSLKDRERGGALGMLGSILGDVGSDAGGLLGAVGGAFGGVTGGSPGDTWAGASAQGTASVAGGGATYEHHSASTARNAERSAASTGRDIPLDRATLDKMYESGLW